MSSDCTTQTPNELVNCLCTLKAAASELLRIAQEKLDAIRAARPADLQALAAVEAPLIARYADAEQARRAAMTRLAHSLHRPSLAQAPMREVADLLPAAERTELLSNCDELRHLLENLRRKNAMVADVARDLQGIVRDVLLEAVRRTQDTVAYGPDGRHALRRSEACVEAVA